MCLLLRMFGAWHIIEQVSDVVDELVGAHGASPGRQQSSAAIQKNGTLAALRAGSFPCESRRRSPMPAGTDIALFIQIARADFPQEPAEDRVAVLNASYPPVE